MGNSQIILKNCLYFSSIILARSISKLADEKFKQTGLSPSHAFTLMIINEQAGITPTEIAFHLQITPSTVTRFIDQLEKRRLIERVSEGKAIRITSTDKGKELQEVIDSAWGNLKKRYTEILGEKYTEVLTQLVNDANEKINE
jgi:MarR family transcriptional regulator, organic hydroperoxide resistance regulator